MARPLKSAQHQVDSTLRFRPVADDYIFEFVVQKLFGSFFEMRIHFHKIGEHAQRTANRALFRARTAVNSRFTVSVV